jgi:hypothetical protein
MAGQRNDRPTALARSDGPVGSDTSRSPPCAAPISQPASARRHTEYGIRISSLAALGVPITAMSFGRSAAPPRIRQGVKRLNYPAERIRDRRPCRRRERNFVLVIMTGAIF